MNVYTIYWTDGDTLCYIDFRSDRMRQINETTGIKPPFETAAIPQNLVCELCVHLIHVFF